MASSAPDHLRTPGLISNRPCYEGINVEWVDTAMAQTSHQRVILDMDSSESPVHGQQEGVAYNGHFESVC